MCVSLEAKAFLPVPAGNIFSDILQRHATADVRIVRIELGHRVSAVEISINHSYSLVRVDN
jgi:hypothetical protein